MPLYWWSRNIAASDKAKSLELMMSAFVEDVLTHGDRAMQGFAASSLASDFGIESGLLVRLKEYVIGKTKPTFCPDLIVDEFLKNEGHLEVKAGFGGVTEESRLNSIVKQVTSLLEEHLRPSLPSPGNEKEVQTVVFTLLRQIDKNANREKRGPRVANKEYTIDFALYGDKVGVEVKLIKSGERSSPVIDQINADVKAYATYFDRVVFVIFDSAGSISDRRKFISELKGQNTKVEITVV